jgi:5'-deoxynucleotidase YfbR-like HD superfamily hydrolase
MSLDQIRLAEVIKDAIAQKRVIKWGYVRQFGGLYPAECDTVAAHSSAVSVLATILSYEYADAIEASTSIRLRLDDIALLAIYHDIGEGRSGDTGAYSHAVRGVCNLHSLEREGLEATVLGLKIQERVLKLFDDYRTYRTPEAIVVHVADNLEGFEKAIHSCRRHGLMLQQYVDITRANVAIYKDKSKGQTDLGKVCAFVLDHILVPGIRAICDAYSVDQGSVLLGHDGPSLPPEPQA